MQPTGNTKTNTATVTTNIKAILKENYFNFQDHTYTQQEGLAMGAPTSATFSEIYLQYIEHIFIYDIVIHNNVRGYFRYVDEILLIYDTEITDNNSMQ
jgi:hypothetical protein